MLYNLPPATRVDGYQDRTRQRGSCGLVAEDILVGRDGFHQRPVPRYQRRAIARAGGRPTRRAVRQGPHQAELLFVNPEDTNGFPVQ